MITESVQLLFKTSETPVVLTNDTYQFSIRCAKISTPKLQLLFTDGLSKNLQNVNEKNKGYERIEVYFLLPDYWDLSKNNWPINWLNRIAQVPQKNETWFGPGDTLPAGNPAAAIDSHLKTTYFILTNPILLEADFKNSEFVNTHIKMLAVIPIFKKEFDFKMQNSAFLLLRKMAEKNYTELIDEYRLPVARKKFMGLF